MLGLDWWSTILKHPHMWKFENARLTGVHNKFSWMFVSRGYKILGSGGLAASLFWLKENPFPDFDPFLMAKFWPTNMTHTLHEHHGGTARLKLCILILGRSFSTRSHSRASMAVASMPTGLLARTLAWISSTLERPRCSRQCRKLFFDKLCKRADVVLWCDCLFWRASKYPYPIYMLTWPSQPNSQSQFWRWILNIIWQIQLNWPPGWCQVVCDSYRLFVLWPFPIQRNGSMYCGISGQWSSSWCAGSTTSHYLLVSRTRIWTIHGIHCLLVSVLGFLKMIVGWGSLR